MRRLVVCALSAGLAGCANLIAGPGPQPASGPPSSQAAAQSGSSFKPWSATVEGATHREGFFDTYEKGDKLFLAVPADRLGEDFLMTYQIARGVGAEGLYGGTMLDIFEGSVVALERHDDRVFLVRRPVRFTAGEGTAEQVALETAYGSSVLASGKIESEREDGTVLVDVYDWVVSDLAGVGELVGAATMDRPAPRPPTANFDRSRSYLESVGAFPENLNVRATLTYRPPNPAQLPSVADGRYVPVTVAYVMAKLPEQPMAPRPADDRVGYFMTVRKDFSQADESFFVRNVNRWRLEPSGERVDGLMVPKEPIVYYIDPSVPERWRPYLAAGVEAWSEAFEAAGWKDAIRAEPLPEGAAAEDLRYPTLRWNVSDRAGYGAIGPSVVDPRTGEILDADILFEANMVLGFKRDWRTVITPAAALQEAFASPAAAESHATFAAEIAAQGGMLRAALAAAGRLEPGEAVPDEYVGEALKWVAMHEVGHTLGLRHNFRSSTDTPLERLHDREWTGRNGVFSSVMDYPALNLAGDGRPNGFYYNPAVGSYDRWAISFGYADSDADAARVARDAALPGHAYGTDEDAVGPFAIDPTVNVYDLGADPLAWGRGRAALIEGMWDELPSHVLADNDRYADLTDAFNTLLVQYSRAFIPAVKYVGGQYQHRDRVGDPQGRAPWAAVPRSEQREALDFLNRYAFSERAFRVSPEVLARLGANRWSHWGQSNTFNGRIDFPYHERVLGVQRALLEQLTSPARMAAIRDAETKFGSDAVLPIPELMEELTRSVWSEAWTGRARNVPAMRRDLQRAYLDRMTEVVTDTSPRMPGDAKAVARRQLLDLRGRVERALAQRGRLDAYTTAHLVEARARIDKTLEAGLEAERS